MYVTLSAEYVFENKLNFQTHLAASNHNPHAKNENTQFDTHFRCRYTKYEMTWQKTFQPKQGKCNFMGIKLFLL